MINTVITAPPATTTTDKITITTINPVLEDSPSFDEGGVVPF